MAGYVSGMVWAAAASPKTLVRNMLQSIVRRLIELACMNPTNWSR